MKNTLKKYSIYLIVFILSAQPCLGYAEKKPLDELKFLEKTLEQQKTETNKLDEQISNAEAESLKLKEEMIKLAKQTRSAEVKLGEIDDQLNDLKTKKEKHYNEFDRDRKALAELSMALQRLSRIPKEALLTSPEKPINTARSASLLKHALPQIQERAEKLKQKIEEIEKIETDISSKQAEQKSIHEKLKLREADLSKLLKKQQKIFKSTATERKNQEQEAKRLADKARNLSDLVKKLDQQAKEKIVTEKPPVQLKAMPKGMTWPIYGKIKTSFGEKDDLGAKSQGITIIGSSDAVVTSPMGGKVKFAGPFQKFKHILIIEHTGGYHSLIAGLSRIDTVVDAKVSAGEPVGVMGDTNGSSRLYYELRKNGEPVNPKPILASYSKKGKN